MIEIKLSDQGLNESANVMISFGEIRRVSLSVRYEIEKGLRAVWVK